MAEGHLAGRLLLEIEASAAGFARDLRDKVDAAAAGVTAKIGIELDGEGLRKRLKAIVKTAAKGVTATVKVDVDQDDLRGKLEGAVANAASRVRAQVRATPDEDHFRQELQRVVTAAAGDSSSAVRIRPDIDRSTLVDAVRRRVAEAGDDVAQGGGVSIPFKLPGRTMFLGAILALVQPAVGALAQLGAGLTAMVGSALPAVNTLGALPGILVALGAGLLSTKVLFGGVGTAAQGLAQKIASVRDGTTMSAAEFAKMNAAIAGVAPSARDSITAVLGFQDAWKKIKLDAQERFFSRISRELTPLGNTLLPLVRDQLDGVAGVGDRFATSAARWMQTPVFRADAAAIVRSNSRVLGTMSLALGEVGHATEDVLVSSGPFVERLAEATRRGAQWARNAASAARENGSLNRAMNEGADVASSFGRSVRSLGKGLGGVFTAGRDSGNSLLAGMEKTLDRFDKWTHSDAGKSKMKDYFDQALPGAREMIGLVGDLARGLAKLGADGGITSLVSQVRTQLVPAIGALITGLGSLGPHVVGALSNVAEIIGRLASGASAFGPVLAVFSGLANILAVLLRTVPGLSTALGGLLVVMLAIKATQGIGGMFTAANANATGLTRTTTGLVGTFRGLNEQIRLQQWHAEQAGVSLGRVGGAVSALQSNVPRLQSTIPTVDAMNRAFLNTRSAAGDAASSVTGVGSAMRVGLKGAMTGLVNFMGGPMGLAVAGLGIGLGLLANYHQRATQAAADQRRAQQNLTTALRDTHGAVTTDVRTTAAQLLQDTKVLDGKQKLLDVMAKVNVGLPELTTRYLGLNGGLKELSKTMNEQAEAALKAYRGHPTDELKAKAGDAERAAKAIQELLKVQESEAAKTKEAAAAAGSLERSGLVYEKLKGLVGQYSNATLDATARTDALKSALDLLAGGTLSFKDAQARADGQVLSAMQAAKSAIDERNGALKESNEYLKGWGAELLQADGSLKTTTDNGHQLYNSLVSIRDATLDSTRAAYDLAISQKKTVPEAIAVAKTEMGRLYDAAIKAAMGYGLSKEQAEKAAAAMGLVPDKVTTLLAATGVDSVIAQLAGVQGEYAKVPGSKQITVQAMTNEAQQLLQSIGYTVVTLPDGQVQITTTSATANAELDSVMKALATIPPGKKLDVDVPTLKAMGQMQAIQDKLTATPGQKSITVEAPSELAISQLQAVGFKVERLPDHQIKISAPSNEVEGSVSLIQRAINALKGKTVSVDVQYNYPAGLHRAEADGGILRFANGGILARMKAFANGAERHIAQIARPGEWRVWAEPETGGEAYIPLSPAKRGRSEQILDRVAEMFGGQVVYNAAGALRQPGGLTPADLYRSSTQHRARAAAAAAAQPAALVNGDLIITRPETESSGDALTGVMFQLRRTRLGGVHAGVA
ncbi:hypothetical protein [Kitasatospora sp. NPDC088548]|uniref:hypothetical protein n=1 Tax=Kitasatospora sp. NPDC088548 TaxID=3364075 RepID=UPI003802D753